MNSVEVALGDRSYAVLVGRGAAAGLRTMLPAGVRRVALVTQANIGFEVDPGVDFEVCVVPDGEVAKSLSEVERLCRRFARYGLSRSDAVVGVGGGVVTDLAGFAAATFLRGVRLLQVPTSLLGQVDAAIGGKCGVNIPEGKNLVGAFWQPSAVICDTSALDTLPEREWASGRGEIAKYCLLDPGANRLHAASVEDQVTESVRIKADVVASDERESGRRAILNYGHTLAHALEAVNLDGHDPDALRHGEAVAMGLAFAALLARRMGRIDDKKVDHHFEVLDTFGLPASIPSGSEAAPLLQFMGRDKKAVHDLTFVLDGPAGVELVAGVSPDLVLDTLHEMGAR